MSRSAVDGASVLPALEYRSLLEHASGWSRAQTLTRSIDDLEASARERFDRLIEARLRGEPIAYLLGSREFRSRSFVVDSRVLIPRHETEHLVDVAIDAIRASSARPPRVLDLGTGSGVLAITIALECPDTTVVATDASADALEVARINATRLGASVQWRRGSWYAAIGDTRFDFIVSNPPYIANGDPHLDEGDLRFEPRDALTDGDDGMKALAAIIDEAPSHLHGPGFLAVEHGFDQGAATRRRFQEAGFTAIETTPDLAGRDRVTSGRWAGPRRPPAL